MNHLSTDALWAYARKEASPDEVAVARVHLETCADCRVVFTDIQAATSLLAALPEPPPMPQELAWRVGDKLADELDGHFSHRLRSWWVALASPRFALAVAAVAMAGVVAYSWLKEASPVVETQPVQVAQPVVLPVEEPLTPTPPEVAPQPVREAYVASARNASTARQERLGEGATVATQKGGQVWLKLPDGSRAGLTGSSKVTLQTMKADEVTLDLAAGSLAMVVPHREDRVLKVTAGEVTVKDLGTRFLVSREAARTLIAVEEGVVEVETPAGTRELREGRALRYADGKLTEFEWEGQQRAAPPPVVKPPPPRPTPEEPEPQSVARLQDEDDDDEDEPDELEPPPDQVTTVTPAPSSPPPTYIPPPERGFSLKKLERKLRSVGARFTAKHSRESQVNNIAMSLDAGDCHHVLTLAGRWLSAPVTRLKNEPQLRWRVKSYQAQCLRTMGRVEDAERIEAELTPP